MEDLSCARAYPVAEALAGAAQGRIRRPGVGDAMEQTVDVVLSAGWLAFARHLGFLQAVQESGLSVDAVVGTSSGSLVGALWAAGLSLDAIEAEVSAMRPIASLRPSWRPITGLCSMRGVMSRLRRHLPQRIEGLERPFAVGVASLTKRPVLLTEGPLVEAVAASCAVPALFAPVNVGGRWWLDGGWVDRTAVQGWRQWRPGRDGIVHLVEPSEGTVTAPEGVRVVRSPPSGARLWSLGDVCGQRESTRRAATTALRA